MPSHPVAVPMIEFAFPVSGDIFRVRLSSGRGYTRHHDFMNARGRTRAGTTSTSRIEPR